MPKAAHLQSSFNSGEFSPLAQGRVDADRYKTGLASCENFVPVAQGPITRRPGTYFAAKVKDSSKKTRLQAFEFSTTQAYILEFGNNYIRFFMNGGPIMSGGVPYEISVPYLEADIFDLKFTQSADVLYIVHPKYKPAKLSRTGHTNWTLTDCFFLDGPYLAKNRTTTTLVSSANSGTTTVTASSTVGINNDQGFSVFDVGRLIRIVGDNNNWGSGRILGYTDPTTVTVLWAGSGAPVSPQTAWRLGVWSANTGYPSCAVFHEDRLFLGGCPSFPERVDASNTADYENFAPSLGDGTIVGSHALAFSFNSNEVNAIRWMTSDERGLNVGTTGSEWNVRASTQGEALTPTNIMARKCTSYGSENIVPAQIGKATMFVQRGGRKLREMVYFYDAEGYRANDLTLLSEHVTGPGIAQLAVQKHPHQLVWCVRTDGVLAAMNYEREVDVLRVGWSRHLLGGALRDGSVASVESVAVIPSVDGSQPWFIVKRYIDGQIVKTIEYLMPFFDQNMDQEDAFFLDCGLSYDVPVTVTGITQANPPVVTAVAHGFSNGDKVKLSDVAGITKLAASGPESAVNGQLFTIANVTADTFELSGEDFSGPAVSAYISGGKARKAVTTISGLGHLEGQTVSILADGAVQPQKTVTGGAIDLSYPASVVNVGLGYLSKAKLLRIEAGAANGAALTKTQRIYRIGLMIYRTLGILVNGDRLTFRRASDKMTKAAPLVTEVFSETLESDYSADNMVELVQDKPLPATICAAVLYLDTQDR